MKILALLFIHALDCYGQQVRSKMTRLTLLRFVSLVLFLNLCAAQEDKPPCSLSWSPYSSGDIPEGSIVASFPGAIFIARSKQVIEGVEKYLLGWYNVNQNSAHFFYNDAVNGTLVVLSSVLEFELLDNPNRCNVGWKNGPTPPKQAVKFASDDNTAINYIARAPSSNEFWYPGLLDENNTVVVLLDTLDVKTFESYQVLTSSVGEVELVIEDFEFETDNLPTTVDNVGIDVLSNDANSYMTQYVSHRRKVIERFEIPIRKETTKLSKYTDAVTKKAGFPSFFGSKTNVQVNLKATMGVEETKIEIRETEINIEKVVVVPPHSTVTVCSTVDLKDNIEMNYVARGVYTAGGLSAEELLELLSAEGIPVSIGQDGQVQQRIEGTFKGSLVFSSNFMAIDGVHLSCAF